MNSYERIEALSKRLSLLYPNRNTCASLQHWGYFNGHAYIEIALYLEHGFHEVFPPLYRSLEINELLNEAEAFLKTKELLRKEFQL